MPLVVSFIGKEKRYLLATNCFYACGVKIAPTTKRLYKIQKFKNFVIGYNGDDFAFQKLVNKFDFDSFPEPLTKSYLMRNFYKDYLNFLFDETNASIEDGALKKSDFSIMILGKDYSFDIGSEYLYEIYDFNANGDDEVAFNLYHFFNENMNDMDFIKLLMDKTTKYSYVNDYPFLMVSSDDLDTLHIFYKDGSEKIEKLEELWGNK